MGGRTYLSGISPQAKEHLVRTGHFTPAEGVYAFDATSILGASTAEAIGHARTWLLENRPDDQP